MVRAGYWRAQIAPRVVRVRDEKDVELGRREGVGAYERCLDLPVRSPDAMRLAATQGQPGPDAKSDCDRWSFALPGEAMLRYLDEKEMRSGSRPWRPSIRARASSDQP